MDGGRGVEGDIFEGGLGIAVLRGGNEHGGEIFGETFAVADVNVSEIGMEFVRGKNFGKEVGFLEVGGDVRRLDAACFDFGDEEMVVEIDVFGAFGRC